MTESDNAEIWRKIDELTEKVANLQADVRAHDVAIDTGQNQRATLFDKVDNLTMKLFLAAGVGGIGGGGVSGVFNLITP